MPPMIRTCCWLLGGLLLASPVCAGDWPQWLGPQRNGVSDETLAPWTAAPKVAWKRSVGNGFSVPVIAEGKLFVHAGGSEKETEEVWAFDVKTGEEVWHDTYPRAVYRSALGTGPRGTPTVADGRLLTIGITGVLSCYDIQAGKLQWRVNPYEELEAQLPGFGVCSSPVVAEKRVILPVGGAESAIVAYDTETGKLAWKALDEPAASASPIVIVRGAGETAQTEVVVQTTLRLVGLSPVDGAIHWEHPLVFQPSGVSPTPLAVGNLLVCTTQDTGTLTLELPQAIGAPPQVKWWHQDLASYFSTGTIDPRGRVLLVTNQTMPLPRADVRCYDLNEGKEIWHKTGLGYFHVGLILLSDQKLLLLDDAGNLVLAESGPENYKELAKAKVCRGTFCNPLLSNGRVFVRDSQEVICLDFESAASDGK